MSRYYIYHATGDKRFTEAEIQPRTLVGSVNANTLQEAFVNSQTDFNDKWEHRSTSVGDVIAIDDEFYMVKGLGFIKLGDDEIDDMKYDNRYMRRAFNNLMGVNGDQYFNEIATTGKLSKNSYDSICDNISHNGKESVIKFFGLVHWYYLESIKQRRNVLHEDIF